MDTSLDINTIRGLLTVTFMVMFLAIIAYAWSARNRRRFEEAGRMIFDDVPRPTNEPAGKPAPSRRHQAGLQPRQP